MRRIVPAPKIRVVSVHEAIRVRTFAKWYADCMYHPQWGYYSGGKVTFGLDGDFSTYPQRLSPVFGWMMCDALRHLLAPILERVGPDEPVTLLEFGAGDGDLAADILERFDRVDPLLTSRLRYRIVERSPVLRERQRARLSREIASGHVEVVDGSITSYRPDNALAGVAFANEVLDALPCDQLHITSDAIYRTHVATTEIADGPPRFVEEWHVDLAEGWVGADGIVSELPPRLSEHLERIAPLIDDLRVQGMVPFDYYWSEDAANAVETFAHLGRDGSMAGLFIDYGGTSRHVLNRTLRPHLRVYSRDEAPPRAHDPYTRPGEVDVTWDQDFTALASLAAAAGMGVHFAHQRILEPPERPLDGGPFREELVRRQAELGLERPEAVAAELVAGFREARGFRTLLLTSPDLPLDTARFGPSDPWEGEGLATIAPSATREQLHEALAVAGHPELAMVLGRGCDIIGTLSDVRRYGARAEVLAALRQQGLLS